MSVYEREDFMEEERTRRVGQDRDTREGHSRGKDQ